MSLVPGGIAEVRRGGWLSTVLRNTEKGSTLIFESEKDIIYHKKYVCLDTTVFSNFEEELNHIILQQIFKTMVLNYIESNNNKRYIVL